MKRNRISPRKDIALSVRVPREVFDLIERRKTSTGQSRSHTVRMMLLERWRNERPPSLVAQKVAEMLRSAIDRQQGNVINNRFCDSSKSNQECACGSRLEKQADAYLTELKVLLRSVTTAFLEP